ncbi:MAG: hypothetical protein K2L17_06915 [Muribaculaceae bacterium]|nr:hypothetical protein [Muribaculaceae bacterium]
MKIILLRFSNYANPKIHSLEAFIGSRFQVGIWQPVVNVGIMILLLSWGLSLR